MYLEKQYLTSEGNAKVAVLCLRNRDNSRGSNPNLEMRAVSWQRSRGEPEKHGGDHLDAPSLCGDCALSSGHVNCWVSLDIFSGKVTHGIYDGVSVRVRVRNG